MRVQGVTELFHLSNIFLFSFVSTDIFMLMHHNHEIKWINGITSDVYVINEGLDYINQDYLDVHVINERLD